MSPHWGSKDMDADICMSYVALDLTPTGEVGNGERTDTQTHVQKSWYPQWVVCTLIAQYEHNSRNPSTFIRYSMGGGAPKEVSEGSEPQMASTQVPDCSSPSPLRLWLLAFAHSQHLRLDQRKFAILHPPPKPDPEGRLRHPLGSDAFGC